MEAIFEIFIELFFAVWESINSLFMPLVNLVGEYAPRIVGFVSWLLTFIVDILFYFIESIIDFLDFDFLKDLFKEIDGGGAGGGGMGIR